MSTLRASDELKKPMEALGDDGCGTAYIPIMRLLR